MVKTAFAYILIGTIPLGFYLLQVFGFDLVAAEFIEKTFTIPVYLGFVLIGFLGWRLNQPRVLMVALLMIGTYYAFLHTELLVRTGIGTIRLRQILCFAFPASLLLVFMTKDVRFLSKQSFFRAALVLSPIAIMSAWFIFSPAGLHKFVSWVPFPSGKAIKIPQVSIVAVFALLLFLSETRQKNQAGTGWLSPGESL